MKTVAVIQSNYIPWKGYFDIINDVDVFIFRDDLQYTKGDWRNRNRIKTPEGAVWMTIPVGTSEHRLICEVEIPDSGWARKHWLLLQQHYGKAPHFDRYRSFLEEVYRGKKWTGLSELNQYMIRMVAKDFLGITVEFRDSREYGLSGRRTELLVELLQKEGAKKYVSGPASKSFVEEWMFQDAGIELVYKDYSGYPEYPQAFPPFDPRVTILDLLFNTGPDAPNYIWGWRTNSR